MIDNDINITYYFEKSDTMAPDDNILENVLWINAGNTVRDGMFDHNQDDRFDSTFSCIMSDQACFDSILCYLETKSAPYNIEIHTHITPDIDCICSIFVIIEMLRKGKKRPAETFDDTILEQLSDYVNKIQKGLRKYILVPTLYAYFCKIGLEIKDNKERSRKTITEGLKLLELVVKALNDPDRTFDLFRSSLEDYIEPENLQQSLECYSETVAFVVDNARKFDEEIANNIVKIETVNLWNKSQLKPVKAAIWEKVSPHEDEYVLAREAGCMLTVYPYSIKEDYSDDSTTHVVIALNPELEDVDQYTLLPLAEVIEQCEQIEEALSYENSHRYRRDHSISRAENTAVGKTHFSQIPFCETSDPWMISAKEDIIFSPGVGSILPYDVILSIIRNESFVAQSVSLLQYRYDKKEALDGNKIKIEDIPITQSSKISFGELYQITHKNIEKLNPDKEVKHLFCYVKVDHSMLRYNNYWLKSCCLHMVGKNDSEFSKDNIFYLDYNTCLYTDQSITILAVIDGRTRMLDSLINEQDLKKSHICEYQVRLLEHQLELRDIGTRLSETARKINDKSEEIDTFNDRLITLNTKMEQNDMITDPLEQDVYAFIKQAWRIEALKNNVITSAKLLIENAEEQRDRKAYRDRRDEEKKEAERDNRIQTGIGLVTIFAVFSAWVDCFDFFAKLVPGKEDGWTALFKNNPKMFALEVILSIVIAGLCCIAAKYVFTAWYAARKKNKDENDQNTEEDQIL